MQKEIIKTNQKGYELAQDKHQDYLDLVEGTAELIKQTFEIEIENIDLRSAHAFNQIAERFAEKHKKQNTLNLRPLKLMELMELNPEKIIDLLGQINLNTQPTAPKLADFQIFATTPEQIERLKIAKEFMALLPKLGTPILGFRNPYNAPVKYDLSELVVNHHWILNTRGICN